MPTRDTHSDCLACLGVDHAVLAANAAGDCQVCRSLPKELKTARLARVREIFAAEAEEEQQQDGVQQQVEEEEDPHGDDPEPAGAQASQRGASSRSPPPQEEEEEEDRYEPDYEHRRYDDGSRYESRDDGDFEEAYYGGEDEEEEFLYGAYPPEVAEAVLAALKYERMERDKYAAQVAVPAPAPAAAEAAPPPPPRRKLPPLECDEVDPVSLFKDVAECCGVPWPVSAAPKAMLQSSLYMAFGTPKEPQREKLLLPIVPDFTQFLKASWDTPSEAKAISPLLVEFNTAGAKEAGLRTMPVMDRHVAEHLLGKDVPSNKEPVFGGSQDQAISKLVRAAYSSAGSSAEASNALSMLQYATFSLLHDMGEKPTKEQILLLRRMHREQMAFSAHVVASTGRAMAQLVQVERSRWLTLSKTIKDRDGAINQAVHPSSLFSESLHEMVAKHEERKREREALRALMPTSYPKPAFVKPSTSGAFRSGRSWSRNRFGTPRPSSSGAPRPAPTDRQQPYRRPEKRRLDQPDHPPPPPAFRGRGRGRGARGAPGGRSAK